MRVWRSKAPEPWEWKGSPWHGFQNAARTRVQSQWAERPPTPKPMLVDQLRLEAAL